MKKGRFSNTEMEFIEANAEVLSFNEIASQLDRIQQASKTGLRSELGSLRSKKKKRQ